MPSLQVWPASHSRRHAQNATATHVSIAPHASGAVQSSCDVHGVPLPPSSSKGVHTGVGSPETGAGHAASAPAQNGAHTLPPGSSIGAKLPGHAPPSGAGYSGSSGAPPLLLASLLLLSAIAVLLLSSLLLPAVVLVDAPPLDDPSDVAAVVTVVDAVDWVSPSSSPPQATSVQRRIAAEVRMQGCYQAPSPAIVALSYFEVSAFQR
jgi:hypothetical protein